MKSVIPTLLLTTMLAACVTNPVTSGPHAKPVQARSHCTSEVGTKVVANSDGTVTLTGATTCQNENSPFEGLPLMGIVQLQDGTVIKTQPDNTYKDDLAQMPWSHFLWGF